MANRPNVLFLMTDQMQGRVLDPDHVCKTPHFDALAARGMRFTRAYTPNAVCSPARASLMTGRLPHNHGVLTVTHCVDDDQANLRTEQRHWAQSLDDAGYRTGYFGKWHVERTGELDRFGWQTQIERGSSTFNDLMAKQPQPTMTTARHISDPPGYRDALLYGTTDTPAANRSVGVTVDAAEPFMRDAIAEGDPWCCFVSVIEPHDPFVTSVAARAAYDLDAIKPPPNWSDDMADKPGMYRKEARTYASLTDAEKREAAACYYASITEIDEQFGRLIKLLDESGQRDNTIIILTSDHGEFLGAHGLYCKNVSAFEEAYNIPLLFAGPGITSGAVSDARVGLHEVGPTLLAHLGLTWQSVEDSRSFAPVLDDPTKSADHATGYAEYFGTRYWMTQRVIWEGSWKLVWNGFDFDELYNLGDDPYEQTNLAADPAYEERYRQMMRLAWDYAKRTGDKSLLNAGYTGLRGLATYGPEI